MCLQASSNYPAAEMVAMAYVGMYGWNGYEWFGDTAINVQACCSRSSRSDTGERGKYRPYTIPYTFETQTCLKLMKLRGKGIKKMPASILTSSSPSARPDSTALSSPSALLRHLREIVCSLG